MPGSPPPRRRPASLPFPGRREARILEACTGLAKARATAEDGVQPPGRTVRGPGQRPGRQRRETGDAADHPGGRGQAHRAGQPHRAHRGQQPRRRVRGGRAGRHVVLQRLGGPGPRPGRARAARSPWHRSRCSPRSSGRCWTGSSRDGGSSWPARCSPAACCAGVWPGAVFYHDSLTLLPAAFGVLVLQKAYGVTRSAITPRLLPRRDHAGDRQRPTGLASLVASTARGPARGRAGYSPAAGPDRCRVGAAGRDGDLPGGDGAGFRLPDGWTRR